MVLFLSFKNVTKFYSSIDEDSDDSLYGYFHCPRLLYMSLEILK